MESVFGGVDYTAKEKFGYNTLVRVWVATKTE